MPGVIICTIQQGLEDGVLINTGGVYEKFYSILIFTSVKEVMFHPASVCLFVC